MKLQHMTIIFLAIMIPMILILSEYIQVQSKSINLQTQYDTKLIDATQDAITAFQLNTSNNIYSTISNSIRRDILASAKTFANSVASNFGISGTTQTTILKYVPAMLYTLNDGYYIYAPYNIDGNYEHTLKSYIYYSARYISGNTDVVINYSLDNYIVVAGVIDGNYVSRSGYLINLDRIITSGGQVTGLNTVLGTVDVTSPEKVIKYDEAGNQSVDNNNTQSKEYYQNAYEFTSWLMSTSVKNLTPSNAVDAEGNKFKTLGDDVSTRVLNINNSNDPEDEKSSFNQHRREIIRLSIENNLSIAIANYNKKSDTLGTDYNFKMPILSDEDWDKICNNVTITAFMQGVPAGTSIYNNYAIGVSTANNEFVNSKQIYYTNGTNYYHKLNCPDLVNNATDSIVGYKAATFKKVLNNAQDGYYYRHPEFACYHCVVNSLVGDIDLNAIKANNTLSQDQKNKLFSAYYKAIGREREALYKVSDYINDKSR